MWSWRLTQCFLCSTSRGTLGFGFLYFLVELERNYPPLPLITHYLYVSVSIYSFRPMLSILRGASVPRAPPPPWKPNVAAPIPATTGGAPCEVPPLHCRWGPGPPPWRRAMKVEAGTCTGHSCGRPAPMHQLWLAPHRLWLLQRRHGRHCAPLNRHQRLLRHQVLMRSSFRRVEGWLAHFLFLQHILLALDCEMPWICCDVAIETTGLFNFNWIVRSRESLSSQIDLEQEWRLARSVSGSGITDPISSPDAKVITILRKAVQIRVLYGHKM